MNNYSFEEIIVNILFNECITTVLQYFGMFRLGCYYESSSMDGTTQPVLPWVGLVSSGMNLKDCYMGCLKIDIVEKETDLTIGISEGICLCGHAFDASSN